MCQIIQFQGGNPMSWKLGLVMAGIVATVIGGVFLAGQFLLQEELTQLPRQDEPAAPFFGEYQEPPTVEHSPAQITSVTAKDEAKETKNSDVPKVDTLDAKPTTEAPKAVEKVPIDLSSLSMPPPVPQTIEPPEHKPQPVAPSPVPVAPPTPGVPALAPPLPPSPPPQNPNISPPVSSPPVREVVTCSWNIQMEVIKGRTVVTAKAGKDASFRIECDQLDLQAPKGCVRASGKVTITGPGLEGASNVMILNLQEDRLMLEGDVKVKSRRDKQDLELTGDRLSLRLINSSAEAKKASAPMPRISTAWPTAPLPLDFVPVIKGPDDRAQLFRYWISLFR
jgi:hypothetical protein